MIAQLPCVQDSGRRATKNIKQEFEHGQRVTAQKTSNDIIVYIKRSDWWHPLGLLALPNDLSSTKPANG